MLEGFDLRAMVRDHCENRSRLGYHGPWKETFSFRRFHKIETDVLSRRPSCLSLISSL
jgi:hypothetical protein